MFIYSSKHRGAMKRGQSAIEVILLVGFMFLVFTVLTVAIIERMIDASEENNRQIIADLAAVIGQEITIAAGVEDGYARVFEVPRTLVGMEYELYLIPGRLKGQNLSSELVLKYSMPEARPYETVVRLPHNIDGVLLKGKNLIIKEHGIVYLNSAS